MACGQEAEAFGRSNFPCRPVGCSTLEVASLTCTVRIILSHSFGNTHLYLPGCVNPQRLHSSQCHSNATMECSASLRPPSGLPDNPGPEAATFVNYRLARVPIYTYTKLLSHAGGGRGNRGSTPTTGSLRYPDEPAVRSEPRCPCAVHPVSMPLPSPP